MKMEYVLYQAPINCPYVFRDFKFAMENNWDKGDYVPVWKGEIEAETVNSALEELFIIFNTERPEYYFGRSLSVSDIVRLNGKYYYCDSFGWKCPNNERK